MSHLAQLLFTAFNLRGARGVSGIGSYGVAQASLIRSSPQPRGERCDGQHEPPLAAAFTVENNRRSRVFATRVCCNFKAGLELLVFSILGGAKPIFTPKVVPLVWKRT